MSDGRMKEPTNPTWIRALEKSGFDIVRRDPLQAHKEYGEHRMIDVMLDSSGQVRMIVTRKTAETKSENRSSRAGREYRVFIEENKVSIVNYRLRAEDEITSVLVEMEKEIA
jgi:hypothetical protein